MCCDMVIVFSFYVFFFSSRRRHTRCALVTGVQTCALPIWRGTRHTMQMTGQYRIEAPRETVWQALNDVEVLRQCIPGVEEIEKTSDTSFAAKVRAKVGPVSARFAGNVTLSDLDPPNGYTISGEGKGGAAGFARGGARVRLADDGAATLLSYDVDATVGGKLAQIGSRLIDGTAKKMADDFLARFAATVGAGARSEEHTSELQFIMRNSYAFLFLT